MQYKTFATGDQLWYSERNGKQTVVKFITDDGWFWEEDGEERKFSGVEKALHSLVVAAIRFHYWFMSR